MRGQVGPDHSALYLLHSALSLRDPRPVVAAEGGGGEAGLVGEVGGGVGGPGIPDGGGLAHLRRGDDDGVALNGRVGPDEVAVGAGDGEALRLAAVGDQAAD